MFSIARVLRGSIGPPRSSRLLGGAATTGRAARRAWDRSRAPGLSHVSYLSATTSLTRSSTASSSGAGRPWRSPRGQGGASCASANRADLRGLIPRAPRRARDDAVPYASGEPASRRRSMSPNAYFRKTARGPGGLVGEADGEARSARSRSLFDGRNVPNAGVCPDHVESVRSRAEPAAGAAGEDGAQRVPARLDVAPR